MAPDPEDHGGNSPLNGTNSNGGGLGGLDEPLLLGHEEDLEKAEGPPCSKVGGGLHWITAGLIVFSFAAPGAVVGLPFSIGNTGLVFGVLMVLIMTVASVLGGLMLLEVRHAHPQVRSLPELGRACMGSTGFWLAFLPQSINFTGFLPVALLLCAESLQGVVGIEACIDYYIITISLFCLATTQLRDLTNTKYLAMGSLTSIILVALIQIAVVFQHDNPNKAPAALFGPPGPLKKEQVFKTLLGLTTTAWAYAPAFLTVELSSAMKKPSDFRWSLGLSGVLNIILCVGLGVTVVLRWGWDVPDPMFLLPAWPIEDPSSRVLQFLVLIANLVSYALDSVPLVRFYQRSWYPSFKDDWTLRSIWHYFLISLPTFLFALIASIVVGNLLSLLAFVTAFSVPFATQIVPAVLYTWHRATSGPSWKELVVIAFVFTVGCTSFLLCTVAAVGKVSISSLRGPTVIGCHGWIIYSSGGE